MGWACVVMGLEGSSQESGIPVVGTGEGECHWRKGSNFSGKLSEPESLDLKSDSTIYFLCEHSASVTHLENTFLQGCEDF